MNSDGVPVQLDATGLWAVKAVVTCPYRKMWMDEVFVKKKGFLPFPPCHDQLYV